MRIAIQRLVTTGAIRCRSPGVWILCAALVTGAVSGLLYGELVVAARVAELQRIALEAGRPLATERVAAADLTREAMRTLGIAPSGAIDRALVDFASLRADLGLDWGSSGLVVRPAAEGSQMRFALIASEIEVSISGPYPKVRELAGTMLRRHPSLALIGVDLRRAGADRPVVEAQLRWLMYESAE